MLMILGITAAGAGTALATGIGSGSSFGWISGSGEDSGKGNRYAGSGIGTSNVAGWKGKAGSGNRNLPHVTLKRTETNWYDELTDETEQLYSENETEEMTESSVPREINPEDRDDTGESLSEWETEISTEWISYAQSADSFSGPPDEEDAGYTAGGEDADTAAYGEDAGIAADGENPDAAAEGPDMTAGENDPDEAPDVPGEDGLEGTGDELDPETAEAIRYVTGQDVPGYQEVKDDDISSVSGVYMASDDDEGEAVIYHGEAMEGDPNAENADDADDSEDEDEADDADTSSSVSGEVSEAMISSGGDFSEYSGSGEEEEEEEEGGEEQNPGRSGLDPVFSEEAGQLYRSNIDGYVNLRSDPNTNAIIIGQIQPRDICMQMDDEVSGNWIHILYLEGNDRQNVLTGWSSGEYLDRTSIWELTGRQEAAGDDGRMTDQAGSAASSDAIADNGTADIGDLPEGVIIDSEPEGAGEGNQEVSREVNQAEKIWLPPYRLLVQAWQTFHGVEDPYGGSAE